MHKQRRHGLWVIWAFALLLLLLTWFAVGYKIRTERAAEIANINRTNLNLARTLEEHTLRTLKSVDQSVLFLKFQYEKAGAKGVHIEDYVRDGMIINQLFNQLGVIDEHGMYILSNMPNHKVIDLSDRAHFLVHKDTDCKCLFLSKPVLGRASGKWSLQMTRRINKPDGSFGGVVVVSLDPFYFTSVYSEMDLGQGSVISLVGDDGTVRARRTGKEDSVGQDLSGSALFLAAQKNVEGVAELVGRIDQVSRFYAYRRVGDFPLTVFVGVSEREALAAQGQRTRAYLLFGGLFSLIILAFAATSSYLMRKLQLSRDKAEEANRLKSEFLAAMSHELRTPLNGIIGYADLLQEELAEAHHKEFAGVIQSSGAVLLSLVNSLLDFAKIEANELQLYYAQTEVRPLVRHVHMTYLPHAQEKQLRFVMDVADDVPASARLDGVRLTQVLNNLVHNAIKFTDKGDIALNVALKGGRLFFSVKDTGPGIAPEDQQLIFEKFRQVENFENRRHSGTGLGLALSRQLVEQMGGSLQVTSQVGAGSEFHFSIPVEGDRS